MESGGRACADNGGFSVRVIETCYACSIVATVVASCCCCVSLSYTDSVQEFVNAQSEHSSPLSLATTLGRQCPRVAALLRQFLSRHRRWASTMDTSRAGRLPRRALLAGRFAAQLVAGQRVVSAGPARTMGLSCPCWLGVWPKPAAAEVFPRARSLHSTPALHPSTARPCQCGTWPAGD